MDSKKGKTKITVTFGGLAGRLLPSPLKFQLLTDQRPAASKIKYGDNPFFAWRNERGASAEATAAALDLNIERYKQFEQGRYHALGEETVARFCAFFEIHPTAMLQPGIPMPEALLNVLVARLHKASPYSQDYEFCVRALRGEEDDAYKVLSLLREDNERRGFKLVGPFLDLLKNDFTIGGSIAMGPQAIAAIYLDDVHTRLAALEKKTKKPAFMHDDIWRSFNDAALRLYGTTNVTTRIENLRRPFTAFKTEWRIVSDLVKGNPEILKPLLWEDDKGAQFVGGRMLNREQAVEAMLKNYKANQDRNRAIDAAKREYVRFRSDTLKFEHWLKSNDAEALFAYWRNRQVAQAALGTARDIAVPALDWLASAGARPKLA